MIDYNTAFQSLFEVDMKYGECPPFAPFAKLKFSSSRGSARIGCISIIVLPILIILINLFPKFFLTLVAVGLVCKLIHWFIYKDEIIAAQKKKYVEVEKRRERTIQLSEEYEPKIDIIINKHSRELWVQKRKKTVVAEYGRIDDSKWKEEVNLFVTEVLQNEISNFPIKFPDDYLIKKVKKAVEDYGTGNSIAYTDFEKSNPIEFEILCAEELKKMGWNARTTKGSGDQGVDVIADKNGKRAVFQCKKYSKSVGNSAVQEIVAGRSHYSADYAFVISNVEFTKSAKELASTNNVVLWHFTQLNNINKHIFGSDSIRHNSTFTANNINLPSTSHDTVSSRVSATLLDSSITQAVKESQHQRWSGKVDEYVIEGNGYIFYLSTIEKIKKAVSTGYKISNDSVACYNCAENINILIKQCDSCKEKFSDNTIEKRVSERVDKYIAWYESKQLNA